MPFRHPIEGLDAKPTPEGEQARATARDLVATVVCLTTAGLLGIAYFAAVAAAAIR